jgi:hypothetical protein
MQASGPVLHETAMRSKGRRASALASQAAQRSSSKTITLFRAKMQMRAVDGTERGFSMAANGALPLLLSGGGG